MKNLTIKVGDYVRNKYGIAKVLKISEDVPKGIQTIKFDRPICFWVNPETGEERNKTDILPITPNIDLDKIKFGELINLIEEGDYVNGCVVTNRRTSVNEHCGGHPKEIFILKQEGNYYDAHFEWVKEEDIKSIVTKEQFESMEYKIER